MYIGVGDKDNPSSGAGTVYIDDIRLYLSCECQPPPKPNDINYPESDCGGNYDVNWAPSSGAMSYVVEVNVNDGSDWVEDYNGTDPCYSASVGPGSYCYRVKACNDGNCCSGWCTGTWDCAVAITPPEMPASIDYPDSNCGGSYDVNWAPSIGATRYEVDVNDGSGWVLDYNGPNTCYNEDVSSCGDYRYRVRAWNVCGYSDGWRPGDHNCVVAITSPEAPNDINYPDSNCGGDYTVKWAAVSCAEYYELERSKGGGDPCVIICDSNFYDENDLDCGTYRYRVRAWNICGLQAMAILYDNTVPHPQSETYVDVDNINNIVGKNWRLKDVKALSLWLHGIPDLVGSYTGSDPYMLEGDGSGIDDTKYDVFYYLYTEKAGQMTGQVTARVDSIDNTDPLAMAGVMLRFSMGGYPPRDGLDPDTVFAATVVTPCNEVKFLTRPGPGAISEVRGTICGITLPHWIRITRAPGVTAAEHANDVGGSPGDWELVGPTQFIPGMQPICLGLCVTSNSYGEMCTAEFSNVQMKCPISTNIPDPTTEKDIGDYVDNDLQPMYVVLQDSDGNDGIVYYENKNANVTRTADWTEWRIDMNEFITQDVNMCDVNTMYIGVGDKDTPSSGDGTVYIDDIALYAAAFYEPECPNLPTDLVRDGEVDYGDLKVIADNWLIHDYEVRPEKPDANHLVAWYRLEQDADDSANGFDANEYGINTADYVTDKKEGTWALDLKGDANYIEADYVAADYGIQGNNHRTITAWAKTRTFDDEFRGLYEIGGQEERGQDFSMLTSGDEPNVWRANHEGGAPGWDIDFAYPSQNKWVHLAHTYDGTTVRVYADGNAVAERVLDLNTTNLKNFSIGQWTSWGDYYFDGIVDDVRIYDYALDQNEAAYIARNGDTTSFTQPLELLLTPQNLAIDLFVKDPNMINFRDVAELGKHWGETQVWPTW